MNARIITVPALVLTALGCKSGSTAPGDLAAEESPPEVEEAQAEELETAGDIDSWEVPDIKYGEVACVEGALQCQSISTSYVCADDKWILYQVCKPGEICLAGYCTQQQSCTPGDVKGCWSADAMEVCDGSGMGYVPEKCPGDTRCVLDGKCVVTVCNPTFGTCIDKTHLRKCKADGSGYEAPEACPETLQCIGGECHSLCESDIKVSSYLGCEYWTVDLHNWDSKNYPISPPAEPIPHAVVISNPGPEPTVVKFDTKAPGVTLDFDPDELKIPPGETKIYNLPVMNQNGSSINKLSVRITASHPITAHQFNPLNNVNVYSNDASLLLPVNVLGKEYVAISYPTIYAPEMMGLPETKNSGFVTVVAVAKGETVVSLTKVKGKVEAGPGIDQIPYKGMAEFKLQQYEVLNLEAVGDSITSAWDLTGTVITASQPVAVFGGHECTVVATQGKSCCCCDHLEEQLIPLYAWGKEYLAVKNKPRGGAGEADMWLIISGEDGVTVHTDPPIPGVDGAVLDKGNFKYFPSAESFEVKATGKVAVAQYMLSQECTTDVIGDPSMTLFPPVGQLRKDYAILTPAQYAQDWISVIRPVGLPVTMDSMPINESFTQFGSGKFEFAWVKMKAGVHHLSADQGFAVIAYGYDMAVSYGYPGGLNLLTKLAE